MLGSPGCGAAPIAPAQRALQSQCGGRKPAPVHANVCTSGASGALATPCPLSMYQQMPYCTTGTAAGAAAGSRPSHVKAFHHSQYLPLTLSKLRCLTSTGSPPPLSSPLP